MRQATAGMAEAFEGIYKGARWYNGSGSGSQPANTEAYRRFLEGYIAEHDITSAVDIGCGDWKFSWLVDWPEDFAYLGIDVVDRLIRINRHDWTDWGVADIKFLTADVLAMDSLPPADLVIVKDICQHWPNDAIQYLGHLLAGRRALITHEADAPYMVGQPGINADIEPGGYRPVDLRAAPFGWPVREVFEYTARSPGRALVKTVMELRP
jgi:hypothetical protein